MMIGVYNHLLRKVFRFHYHSEKVIGSLEIYIYNVYIYIINKKMSSFTNLDCRMKRLQGISLQPKSYLFVEGFLGQAKLI